MPTVETVMRWGLHPNPHGAVSTSVLLGESVEFRNGEYLIQNIGGRKVTVEPLLPCYTEPAPHLATRLARNTQCAAVAIRNKDSLNELGRVVRLLKKILLGTVARHLAVHRVMTPDDSNLLQTGTSLQR